MLETAIAAKPDGLIVPITDATALQGPLNQAIASGIPVIASNIPDMRPVGQRIPYLDLKRMAEECNKVLQETGIKYSSPDTVTAVLSGGERQSINIGRAMYFEARLIIMDEPTNHLSVRETELVLEFIEKLK